MSNLDPLSALLCAAALLGGCASPTSNPAPPPRPAEVAVEAPAETWTLLFDGYDAAKSWRGFKQKELPASWVVEDGCLVMKGGGGDIVTRDVFDDFELRLEWKISEGGNSGVFFRVDESHDYVWETGPELQILDDARHRDGQSKLTRAGANYALNAPSESTVKPAGEWNRARLIVKGAHVEHWLNGTKIVEYELWSPAWQRLVVESKFASMPDYGRNSKGRIALQDHGDLVWFRDIKIRRL